MHTHKRRSLDSAGNIGVWVIHKEEGLKLTLPADFPTSWEQWMLGAEIAAAVRKLGGKVIGVVRPDSEEVEE